jgi:hypothetical protein
MHCPSHASPIQLAHVFCAFCGADGPTVVLYHGQNASVCEQCLNQHERPGSTLLATCSFCKSEKVVSSSVREIVLQRGPGRSTRLSFRAAICSDCVGVCVNERTRRRQYQATRTAPKTPCIQCGRLERNFWGWSILCSDCVSRLKSAYVDESKRAPPEPPTYLCAWCNRNVEELLGPGEFGICVDCGNLAMAVQQRPTHEKRLSGTCSFCGCESHNTRTLIAGPTVFICDHCVVACTDAQKSGGPIATGWHAHVHCSFCGMSAAEWPPNNFFLGNHFAICGGCIGLAESLVEELALEVPNTDFRVADENAICAWCHEANSSEPKRAAIERSGMAVCTRCIGKHQDPFHAPHLRGRWCAHCRAPGNKAGLMVGGPELFVCNLCLGQTDADGQLYVWDRTRNAIGARPSARGSR